jgi:hypothetical protein
MWDDRKADLTSAQSSRLFCGVGFSGPVFVRRRPLVPVDLSAFEGRVPYASEVYGVYQPLLGWKSKRQIQRVRPGVWALDDAILAQVAARVRPQVDVHFAGVEFEVAGLRVGEAVGASQRRRTSAFDTLLLSRVGEKLAGVDPSDLDAWVPVFGRDELQQFLDEVRPELAERYRERVRAAFEQDERPRDEVAAEWAPMLRRRLAQESVVAGALATLAEQGANDVLRRLFFEGNQNSSEEALALQRQLDPLETFDPATDLDRVSLSPLGLVHLFRQWFFEFDTFLGPPVQHVWLSPGGTVELVEVATRRTIVERTFEQSFESVQRSEQAQSVQDELSEAIRDENESNSKLGFGVDTNTGGSIGVFSADVGTSTSFEVGSSQKRAREQIHKTTRQQSEKVTTELKQSFKSTFRTVTETTDQSTKRYLLINNSEPPALLNYELRRKMRQVGVQLQDIGTRLCWHSYVDKPGAELGIAKLVHLAEPPDLTQVTNPQLVPAPAPEIRGQPITLSGEWFFEDSQVGFIPFLGEVQIFPPEPGFVYSRNELVVTDGLHWAFEARPIAPISIPTGPPGGSEQVPTRLQVGVVTAPGGLETDEHPRFTIQLTIFFRPSAKLIADVNAKNDELRAQATAAAQKLAEEAYFKAARERVKQAAAIAPRKFEDLREEERIVVYRALVRQLLHDVGLQSNQPELRHAIAELISAMFDMDAMLYFVAPEWWVPKPLPAYRPAYDSPQSVGVTDHATFDQRNVVSWGGAAEARPDNYYITDDSAPAHLGASLGWLLQLDGDNPRNAFLNAPWVKAVVPIRVGKELAALNWLTFNHVEGSEGLEDHYQPASAGENQKILDALKAFAWPDGDPLEQRYQTLSPDDLRIHDAIRYLAITVKARADEAVTKVTDADDPQLNYLPTDKVFEKGFTPLPGGFVAAPSEPFEIFDQWIEVVPTDQIVPVEVAYNPKTGRQQ